MILLSYYKKIFILCLCALFLFFSCSLFDQDDDDDDVDNDIRILPDDIEQELESIADNAPSLTELRVIGYSSGSPSYPIYALKITDNPDKEENEPEIQMTGGIHGNEQLSCIMVLRLIDYLLDNYDNDPEIKYLIDNSELHFFPSINPYGLSQDIRHNANNVDLNRNFGWAWVNQEHHGDSAMDQPESQAIRDDAVEHPYVLSIHGHTGAACINTLWDYIGTTHSSGTPSIYTEEDFIADYLPTYPFITEAAGNYLNKVNTAGDDSFWMTEGYDWYPVFGSIQDWFYGERGALAFTLEYHSSFNYTELHEALFQEIFDYHKDALLDLFVYTQRGISGIVTGIVGLPVDAKVSIGSAVNRAYNDPVDFIPFAFTNPNAGDYHLPIQPGTYDLTIEADGYITQNVYDVVVPDSEPWAVVVDVSLTVGRSEKRPPYRPPELPADSVPPDLREE